MGTGHGVQDIRTQQRVASEDYRGKIGEMRRRSFKFGGCGSGYIGNCYKGVLGKEMGE